MKNVLLLSFCMFTALMAGFAGEVEVGVSYERQAGRGSNQFAVYIENPQGDIVKTLYVTKFTADGGYVPRPACIPLWTGKSGISEMSDTQIDAITGATPQSGELKYIWNLTDINGEGVGDGIYYIVVEGTYLGENQVLFRGELPVGGHESTRVDIEPLFNSDEEKNRGMLKAVYGRYNP